MTLHALTANNLQSYVASVFLECRKHFGMFSIDLCDTYLLWILNFHFAHTPHSDDWSEPLFWLLDSGEYFLEIPADVSIEVAFY